MINSTDEIQNLAIEFINGQSETTYTKLVTSIKEPLFGYVLKNTKCRYAADDICSEVYMDMYTSSKDYYDENKGRYITWVYSLAKRRLCDYYKESNKRKMMFVDADISDILDSVNDSSDTISVASHSAYKEIATELLSKEDVEYSEDKRGEDVEKATSALYEAVESLPKGYKLAFTERFFNHKTYDKICEDNGITFCACKSRLYFAKKQVKDTVKIKHPELHSAISAIINKIE